MVSIVAAAAMQAKFMVRVTWYSLPTRASVGNRRLKQCLYSKEPAPLTQWGMRGPMAAVGLGP